MKKGADFKWLKRMRKMKKVNNGFKKLKNGINLLLKKENF